MKAFKRVNHIESHEPHNIVSTIRNNESLLSATEQYALFNFSLTELRKRDCLIAQAKLQLNSREMSHPTTSLELHHL